MSDLRRGRPIRTPQRLTTSESEQPRFAAHFRVKAPPLRMVELLVKSTFGARLRHEILSRKMPGRRSGAEKSQYREHAPMVVARLFDPELHEDVFHVGLDRLRAQEEALADALVGTALGHQREHLALALGQLVESTRRSSASDQARDDRRVDDALALV